MVTSERDFPLNESDGAGPSDAPSLTTAEAAAILGVTGKTVARWADHGDLPSFRPPGAHRRFRRSDVLSFLERYAKGVA